MDDIRSAIGAVFDDGDEPIVQSIRDYTIRRYLERGYHVISADTNLPERVVKRLRKLAELAAEDADKPYSEIEVVEQDFRNVSLTVCLARNHDRHARGDFKVPQEAIESMYSRFIKDM